MPSYFYQDFADRPWSERFPEWVQGSAQWQSLFREIPIEELRIRFAERRADPEAWLRQLRPYPVPRPRECPNLFVSHRQADARLALRIAWIANQQGFQFWLDILDPVLPAIGAVPSGQPFDPVRAFLTAAIIEMALINSTHVAATMTQNTAGSMWVPYEYGRVRADWIPAKQAGCWLHPSLRGRQIPEYLLLGAITTREAALNAWLRDQLRQWQVLTGRCHGGANEPWRWGPTIPLP